MLRVKDGHWQIVDDITHPERGKFSIFERTANISSMTESEFSRRVFLPPPNDLVDSIHDLVCGRQEYDYYSEYINKHSNNVQLWMLNGSKKGQRPPHDWRETLPRQESNALLPVYYDWKWHAEKFNVYMTDTHIKRAWCPKIYESLLYQYSPVVDAVVKASRSSMGTLEMKQLRKTLKVLFNTVYKDIASMLIPQECGDTVHGFEFHNWTDEWERLKRQFEDSVDIIALWCCCDFCTHPLFWSNICIEYGTSEPEEVTAELKDRIQDKANREVAKKKFTVDDGIVYSVNSGSTKKKKRKPFKGAIDAIKLK